MKNIYAKAEPHRNQARGGFAYRLKPYTPCAVAGIADPKQDQRVRPCTEAGIIGPATEKQTSNPSEACVLHANEEKKRPIVARASCHGLRIGCDGTDGTLL